MYSYILFLLLLPALVFSQPNSSFFYNEILEERNIFVQPEQMLEIKPSPKLHPIFNFNFTPITKHLPPCVLYQGKVELAMTSEILLENSMSSYERLLIPHMKKLLLLSPESQLYEYDITADSFSFQKTHDFKALLGESLVGRLIYLKEIDTLVILNEKKAIGFKDLDSQGFSSPFLYEEYQTIKTLYKAKGFAHLLIITAGNKGILVYEVLPTGLNLKNKIYELEGDIDARDLSFYETTLLVLDHLTGIMFFSIENYAYLGTFISFTDGTSFKHKDGEVFLITRIQASESNRHITHEILYLKEKKTFFYNRNWDETVPVNGLSFIGDYSFILAGETLKISYHSIPTEWVSIRNTYVAFLNEIGLIDFKPLIESSKIPTKLIGFTNEKLVLFEIKQTVPKAYCAYKQEHDIHYRYKMEALSRNCPASEKAGNSSFYKLCKSEELVIVQFVNAKMEFFRKIDLVTIGLFFLFGFLMFGCCLFGVYLIVKNGRRTDGLEVELESLRKKVKYEKIVEETPGGDKTVDKEEDSA